MLPIEVDPQSEIAREMFQWAPTLGGECYPSWIARKNDVSDTFQWAPTLGGECYYMRTKIAASPKTSRFNGHPPLGVNATILPFAPAGAMGRLFQWAPTLGGECYIARARSVRGWASRFQWAPTLGGECYTRRLASPIGRIRPSFNGHPPLGVNATRAR